MSNGAIPERITSPVRESFKNHDISSAQSPSDSTMETSSSFSGSEQLLDNGNEVFNKFKSLSFFTGTDR